MKKHLQKIGFVLISLLVTFLIAMGPIAKVDGFNVFPWLDIPFHIWGGFLLGLLALRLILIFEIYTDNKIAKRKSMDKMYRFCIYMTAFVFFFGLVLAEQHGLESVCKMHAGEPICSSHT